MLEITGCKVGDVRWSDGAMLREVPYIYIYIYKVNVIKYVSDVITSISPYPVQIDPETLFMCFFDVSCVLFWRSLMAIYLTEQVIVVFLHFSVFLVFVSCSYHLCIIFIILVLCFVCFKCLYFSFIKLACIFWTILTALPTYIKFMYGLPFATFHNLFGFAFPNLWCQHPFP